MARHLYGINIFWLMKDVINTRGCVKTNNGFQGRLIMLFRIYMIRNDPSAGIFYTWWQINVSLFPSVLSLDYLSILPPRAWSHLRKWAYGKKFLFYVGNTFLHYRFSVVLIISLNVKNNPLSNMLKFRKLHLYATF